VAPIMFATAALDLIGNRDILTLADAGVYVPSHRQRVR
jgi:hypothetical protein